VTARRWHAPLAALGALAAVAAGCPGGGACTAPAGDGDEGKAAASGGGASAPVRIVLAPEGIATGGVRWEKAAVTTLYDELLVPAEVVLDPNRAAHVTPITRARVVEVKVSIGDVVAKGDVLAVVESTELGEARAGVAEVTSRMKLAETNVARAREMAAAGVAPAKAVTDAEAELSAARAALSAASTRAAVYGKGGGTGALTSVRSPVAGTVIDRHATTGEIAGADVSLFLVADLSVSWIFGRVYERDVGKVKEGQPATLTLDAWPGRDWSCMLDYVAGALDPETRTLPVRIRLPNPDGALKPGLFGALRIRVGEPAPALAVPADAVQRLGPRTLVFVRAADGAFEPRDVTLGRSVGTLVEVLSGLAAGEDVVVAGTFALKGELLRGAIEED
jgi:cobalt-zinc-cadmium efflux system membrane fusion protein